MFVNGADAGPGCWSSPTHPHSPWQRRAASFYILCLIFLLISHRYKCWPTTRSSGLGGVPRDVQLPAPGLADGQFPKSHSGVLGWGLGGCTEQGRGALPAAEHLVSAYCVPGTSLDEFYSCAFFFFELLQLQKQRLLLAKTFPGCVRCAASRPGEGRNPVSDMLFMQMRTAAGRAFQLAACVQAGDPRQILFQDVGWPP